MSTTVRNVLAVLAGLVIGGIVNMAIVMAGPVLVPPPAGVDMTTAEGLRAAMPLLQPQHFIPAFLAHAVGTFAGALVAYLLAGSHKRTFALVIGGLFLLGGVSAAFMIPAPVWFIALDLIVAYLPMAWLAALIGRSIQKSSAAAAIA